MPSFFSSNHGTPAWAYCCPLRRLGVETTYGPSTAWLGVAACGVDMELDP